MLAPKELDPSVIRFALLTAELTQCLQGPARESGDLVGFCICGRAMPTSCTATVRQPTGPVCSTQGAGQQVNGQHAAEKSALASQPPAAHHAGSHGTCVLYERPGTAPQPGSSNGTLAGIFGCRCCLLGVDHARPQPRTCATAHQLCRNQELWFQRPALPWWWAAECWWGPNGGGACRTAAPSGMSQLSSLVSDRRPRYNSTPSRTPQALSDD